MRDTFNSLLSSPLDIAWKTLSVLTLMSMAEMGRNLMRRSRGLRP